MIINLKELREKRGYTQKELAKQIGVSESLISYWESGSRIPRIPEINKILSVLNIDYDRLVMVPFDQHTKK